jgi:excisionase family DNA binding protein
MNNEKESVLPEVLAIAEKLVGKSSADRMGEPQWMTIEETADYLRCSLRFLREKVANKEVPHTKFGGKALFHRSRIDEWMFSMEEFHEYQEEEKSKEEIEQVDTTILPGVDRDKINSLVQELIDFNERFVTGLGNNVAKDLKEYNYKKLSLKVYAQLSRWAHPNRNTRRERRAKPIVHELSKLLFGSVIGRTKHPSYVG